MKKKIAVGLLAATTLVTAACTSAGGGEKSSKNEQSNSASTLTVSDVAGREVSLKEQPKRVILAEGRATFATSILDPKNPFEHVVALGTDLHSGAPSFEKKLFDAVPAGKDLPTIGNVAKGDVTVENLLAHNPDLIVFTLDHKAAMEKTGMTEKLDQAGLKYVFTDFRQKPLENTTKSVELLGKVLGEKERAAKYNEFYNQKVKDITARVANVKEKPRTLVWRAAGLKDCCATVKESNLGDLVNAAGGKNLGDDLLNQPSGDLTAEKVIQEQPDAIIATGGSWAKDPGKPEVLPHVELGYTATKDIAQKTLDGLVRTPGFEALKAPKEGKLFGAFHQFYDSPYNVFALEQFAAWLHPAEFKDVDTAANFAAFHKEWLPFELSGVFFTHNAESKSS